MGAKPSTQEAIQRDLQAERAAALARATEQLESALAELAAADAACAAAPTPAARELRREALEHAGERLWFLVIQREAAGLNRHEELHEVLRVPPRGPGRDGAPAAPVIRGATGSRPGSASRPGTTLDRRGTPRRPTRRGGGSRLRPGTSGRKRRARVWTVRLGGPFAPKTAYGPPATCTAR